MKSDITDSISNSYNQPAGPSWLDQRYLVWKEFGKNQHTSESSSSEDDEEDTDKGVKEAIQGYTQHKNYVIAWGSPLCDKTRWPIVSRKFIHFCQSNGWTCVWTCVESEFEHVLAEAELNWSSLSCIRQVRNFYFLLTNAYRMLGYCRSHTCQPYTFKRCTQQRP